MKKKEPYSNSFPWSQKQEELLHLLLEEEGLSSELVDTIIPQRGQEKDIPLSFAQQREWFHYQSDPSNPVSNVPLALHLRGALNVKALHLSLQEIIRRHEALRTTFATVKKGPVQIIGSPVTVPLPVWDLRLLPVDERLTEARRLATAESARLFDLTQAPLLRARLFTLESDECVLMLCLHHLIWDGWSIGIFLQELFEHYSALISRRSPRLPDLPIQYADYALWQHQWLQGDVQQTQAVYWKQRLEGAPPAIALPTDRTRPLVNRSQGASISTQFNRSLSEALRAFSGLQEATLFMTMLAVLNILLFHWTKQSDQVIGTVVATRNKKGTDRLIGCFTNVLALRSQISEHMTGLELLTEVKRTVRDAHLHQDYPFEKLVAEITPSGQFTQYPLCNVAFLLQNYPLPHFTQDSLVSTSSLRESNMLQLSILPLILETTALLDLRLMASETPRGIYVRCEYDTDLFEAETIEQLVTSYTHLLEAFVRKPAARISSFDISSYLKEKAKIAAAREQKETIASTPQNG